MQERWDEEEGRVNVGVMGIILDLEIADERLVDGVHDRRVRDDSEKMCG